MLKIRIYSSHKDINIIKFKTFVGDLVHIKEGKQVRFILLMRKNLYFSNTEEKYLSEFWQVFKFFLCNLLFVSGDIIGDEV